MTEQLKQAERALDRMSGYMPQIYKDDLEIVRHALTQALCPPMTDEAQAIKNANRYGWWVSTMFNKPSEVARILAPCTSPDEVDSAIDRAIEQVNEASNETPDSCCAICAFRLRATAHE